MCPGLGAFFQHDHRYVCAFFCGELFQTNGCGKTARATADNDHVVFHCFTWAELGKNFFVCHGGSRSIMGLSGFCQALSVAGLMYRKFYALNAANSTIVLLFVGVL